MRRFFLNLNLLDKEQLNELVSKLNIISYFDDWNVEKLSTKNYRYLVYDGKEQQEGNYIKKGFKLNNYYANLGCKSITFQEFINLDNNLFGQLK